MVIGLLGLLISIQLYIYIYIGVAFCIVVMQQTPVSEKFAVIGVIENTHLQ